MDNEEIKISKILSTVLLNYDFLKKLSKSSVSDFLKLSDFEFVRLFHYNSKIIVDLFANIQEKWVLNTYLFNNRGYLESSYKLNITAELIDNNIINYKKLKPDLEAGSELEELRNSALDIYQKYCEEEQKKLLDLEKKNKSFLNFLRKFFKPDTQKPQLDIPDIECSQTRDLIEIIINKQLSIFSI